MKILQVITSLRTGGAEKLIVDMVPKYKQYGLDVDVLLFDGSNTSFKQQLMKEGVTIYQLGSGNSVYNPFLILKMLPFLRKYDIVHTHNTTPQLFAAIGSMLCSVVLCTTEHNTSNRRRSLKWYHSIDKWMYSRYKEIISISDATTKELKNNIDIKCPIVTIPNGIDIKKFSTARPISKTEIGCENESFLLVMVAGFRHQKDQDTVIRALQLLPSNVQLSLVGDGVRKGECEQLTQSLGLADRVIFTGIRTDVANILKTADVVVMSSHYEGFGLAAVEGMAAGKPVIASDVIGLGDIVRGYGIVFPHKDYITLAHNVRILMDDKEYYSNIAMACQKRACDFDIENMVNRYIEEYKHIADTNPSNS